MLTRKGKIILVILLFSLFGVLAVGFTIVTSLPLAISILVLLFSILFWKPKVHVNRDVHIDNRTNKIDVELSIITEPYTSIEICDELPLGSILEEGSYCRNAITDSNGGLTLRYSVRAFKPRLTWNNVYLSICHPLDLAIKRLKLPIKTTVMLDVSLHKSIPIKTLKKLGIVSRGYMEPVIDRVRPYAIGDDFKLIIPKSLLTPGGPRVKILSTEDFTNFKNKILILAIPSMLYCVSDITKSLVEIILYNILHHAKLNKYEVRIIIPSIQVLDTKWVAIDNRIHEYLARIGKALCNSMDINHVKLWIEKLREIESNVLIIAPMDSLSRLKNMLKYTEVRGLHITVIKYIVPPSINYLPNSFRDLISKIIEEENNELKNTVNELKKIGYVVEVMESVGL